MSETQEKTRLVILQRVCPSYRIPLFRKLGETPGIDFKLLIGEDLPESKVKSSPDLSSLKIEKLKTRFIGWKGRVLPWHCGLIKTLRAFKPPVIICEAESHFLGYLQAIAYKVLFDRQVKLIYWCFIALPGESKKAFYVRWIKKVTRSFFDAFLLYASFGKKVLVEEGYPAEKIFVATNVGAVEKFTALAENLKDTPQTAREKLGLPEQFTVLYLGTLDANKRPELLLDLGLRYKNHAACNFVLLGGGPLLEPLRQRVSTEKLEHVFLPGLVREGLPLYLRAADVLLIPGRGGIIISEAMAFGVPVIVHQADGTEFDLLQQGKTGLIVERGECQDFFQALEVLRKNPGYGIQLGKAGKACIQENFSTEHMAQKIVEAVNFVMTISDSH